MFLFLLCTMTFIEALKELRVFAALRGYLMERQYSFRRTFWITGKHSGMKARRFFAMHASIALLCQSHSTSTSIERLPA